MTDFVKMPVGELLGSALDWAVALCEGWVTDDFNFFLMKRKDAYGSLVYTPLAELKYSTDWALAGPIISRELHAFDHMQSERVCAIIRRKDMHNGGWDVAYGPTVLVAAMRSYVGNRITTLFRSSKLYGKDELDIPKGLVKTY